MHPKSFFEILRIKQTFKKIQEIPLSAKAVKLRAVKLSANITNKQTEDLILFSTLSKTVDELCDINDTEQVSLIVRFICTTDPKEKLLGLLPITRRVDIANVVIECFEKQKIPLKNCLYFNRRNAKYNRYKK